MKRLVLFIPLLLFLACLPQGGPGGTGTPGAVTAGPGSPPTPTAMNGPEETDTASPASGGGSPLDLPAADNPPMAGPGIEGEDDKPRCWFDLEGDEPLIIRGGEASPTIFVRSRQAMASGGEKVDLLVGKGDGVVENQAQFVLELDQDMEKEGIQLATDDGFLNFTFVGSAPGTYSVTARGSLCHALATLVVQRGVVSSEDPPDPSQRVPPASSASSLWNLYRGIPSIGFGEVYQFSGGGNGDGARDGLIPARGGDIPSRCEVSCRRRWSKTDPSHDCATECANR